MNTKRHSSNQEARGYDWRPKGVRLLVLGLLSGLINLVSGDEMPIAYPPKPDEKLFTALKSTSPFLRTLNISETYALRAVATYDDIAVARIYNKETKKTLTIEVGAEPTQGIQLIKVIEPDSDSLSGVAARISFAGEEAELKYDVAQLSGASRAGDSKGRGGGPSGKGPEKRGPSSDERDKYHKLSNDKKEKLKAYIKATVKKYPDMPREERGNLIRGALQKLSDGRDIEVPK